MNSPGDENAEALIIVARAVRTRGLKGEIVADLLTDFPERFEDISELSGVRVGGERKLLELENYWFQNDRVVLKFSGYDTVEAAQTLVGYEFGLPHSERVQLAEDEFYDWELEGCSVEVKDGPAIGNVREVMRTGGVELLVVEDEARREHLIPLAQAIVVEVDVPRKKILIDPPEGLLDL
ncbi:MAG TPA: 16S rRNA processing protein RimM [Blastocatellia bacterium]|jgi:16S rRNA processing protein RimM|nr:16S rRNA processing protein RimM [Blastocatellia bacterium]HAF22495.1 16S rRNA processing protein RimM [Blastocatellia bacterium]HCX31917.1 16S rRNA processing protein RimM [Blastocatellia bacterium]